MNWATNPRGTRRAGIFVLAAFAVSMLAIEARADEAAETLFLEQVQPILTRACVGCHGEAGKVESNLDLRSREAALVGGDWGEPSIVPGDPDASLLYRAVTWEQEDLQMPPQERNRLSTDEVVAIRRWIEAGAPWPEPKPQADTQATAAGDWTTADPSGVVVATSGGTSPEWTSRKYQAADLWAYMPVKRHPVPVIRDGDKPTPANPIDAFLLDKLHQKGLTAGLPADRHTLVRRATLDLLGLPPGVEEIRAFEDDTTSRAYEALVDRLLDSPHYGEQMARLWLDVARYADTSGFSNDFERPNAWRYRDYVVRAFNADKPYDQFIIEQIAGDELSPDDPEMAIAVGFLRSGPWEHTGMSVAAVTRQFYLDDVTNHVGQTFLAQGLRCASCHDHKFDPVPTRDYYRIQACFAPVQFVDREVPYLECEDTSTFAVMRERTQRLLAATKESTARLSGKSQDALAEHLKKRGVKKLSDLPQEEQANMRFFGLSSDELTILKTNEKRRAYFELELRRYEPLAFSVYSGPPVAATMSSMQLDLPAVEKRRGKAQEVRILAGGSLESAGDRVTPGVLSAMSGSNDAVIPSAWNTVPRSTQGRRLALAQWIASANNTLTARVMVNRVWQQHFGTGLVATTSNFGKMGRKPSHPELLDWLATWFVEHGWSVKKLHRLIMTSDAYQRAGDHADMERLRQVDPNNELLAYFSPRRLAAEEIHDAMLAVTGELNLAMGGVGVFPEINWEVALQPRHIMGSVAPAYQPAATPKERNRRTLYAFRFRTLSDPMLDVFDRPGSEISCARRDETTVAPQAFALFNGEFTHDRALALARRAEEASSDAREKIGRAFELAYGRQPTDGERQLCLDHYRDMLAHHQRTEPKVSRPPTSITRHMIEELTGEMQTWTEDLDLMREYEMDLKPWDVGPETRALAEVCLVLLNSNEFLYLR